MAFKTDGSVHRDGVKNEVTLAEKLKRGLAQDIYPDLDEDFKIVPRGGTQYKQDIEVNDSSDSRHISAKNKSKGISNGSFDYVNTSAIGAYEVFNGFRELVAVMKGSNKPTEKVRSIIKDAAHETLKKVSSETLSDILKNHINDKNQNMKFIVSDALTRKDYVFNFADTPLYRAIRDYRPALSVAKGKQSGKILFYDESGAEFDYGLRGRLALNNGVNALLGRSKSNKSSMAVFKVQQDQVHVMIESIDKIQIFGGNNE
tara:strand:+ start:1344 stop:2120 length:777 start_codon:yes stop_codon:yes gene_type:complete